MKSAIKLLKHFIPATYHHMQRVSTLTKLLTYDEDCIQAATMHDIGKCGFPFLVNQFDERLDEHEYEFIKNHVTVSVKMLIDLEVDQSIITIVNNHHENLDGSGYPNGLTGNQICLNSRILRICDSFDAILTRSYAKSRSLEYAFKELHNEKKYDQELVKEFIFHYTSLLDSSYESNAPDHDYKQYLSVIEVINKGDFPKF